MNFDRAKDVFVLILSDIFILVISLTAALMLRAQEIIALRYLALHILAFACVIVVTIAALFITGLYDVRTILSRRKAFMGVTLATGTAGLFAIFFFYFAPIFGITPKLILVLYIALSYTLLLFGRFSLPALLLRSPKIRTVLITRPKVATELKEALLGNNPFPYEIVESFEVLPGTNADEVRAALLAVLKKEQIQAVIVDHTHPELAELAPLYVALFGKGVEILRFEDVYESVFDRIHPISHSPEVFLGYAALHSGVYALCKRALDIAISLPMLILSLPFICIGYVGIKIQDGGAFLFIHERIGKYGKVIRIYKMRTMQRADSGVWVKDSTNTNKVTPFGYFLRKTRIDELPQLWNVLKGDMSLIGPRPDIIDLGRKLAGEIEWYDMRLVVPPGLSGWAQTQMHTPPQSVEESKERLMYDLYYIKHRSLFLDILIGLRTIKTLLSREGA
jgi:lipopolysaccharide/colanic/teichoic acid biosynthesis glycosyltransferase